MPSKMTRTTFEADADRFRWLRNQVQGRDAHMDGTSGVWHLPDIVQRTWTFREAIDAAMAQERLHPLDTKDVQYA